MNPGNEKAALAGNARAAQKIRTHISIVPDSSGYFAGVYVVLVEIPGHPEPRFRKRVYLNLPAAQRAIDRATMHGRRATIQLCQLVPVTGGDAQ